MDCAAAELSIHGDVSLKLQKATNLDLSCRKADIRKMAEKHDRNVNARFSSDVSTRGENTGTAQSIHW